MRDEGVILDVPHLFFINTRQLSIVLPAVAEVNLYIDYSKVIRSGATGTKMPNYKITVRFDSKQKHLLESCIFGVVLGSPGLDW